MIGYFDADRHIPDYSKGALLMLVNTLAITWAWGRIFVKKAIALAISVIVCKYLILVLVLYWIVQNTQLVFFALGIGIFIPAILAMAVKSILVR